MNVGENKELLGAPVVLGANPPPKQNLDVLKRCLGRAKHNLTGLGQTCAAHKHGEHDVDDATRRLGARDPDGRGRVLLAALRRDPHKITAVLGPLPWRQNLTRGSSVGSFRLPKDPVEQRADRSEKSRGVGSRDPRENRSPVESVGDSVGISLTAITAPLTPLCLHLVH